MSSNLSNEKYYFRMYYYNISLDMMVNEEFTMDLNGNLKWIDNTKHYSGNNPYFLPNDKSYNLEYSKDKQSIISLNKHNDLTHGLYIENNNDIKNTIWIHLYQQF